MTGDARASGPMADPTGDADTMLNAEQAGALLGVSAKTIVRAIERGRIPAIHLTRTYRIRRAVIMRLLAPAPAPPVGDPAPDVAAAAADLAKLVRADGTQNPRVARALRHLREAQEALQVS